MCLVPFHFVNVSFLKNRFNFLIFRFLLYVLSLFLLSLIIIHLFFLDLIDYFIIKSTYYRYY